MWLQPQASAGTAAGQGADETVETRRDDQFGRADHGLGDEGRTLVHDRQGAVEPVVQGTGDAHVAVAFVQEEHGFPPRGAQRAGSFCKEIEVALQNGFAPVGHHLLVGHDQSRTPQVRQPVGQARLEKVGEVGSPADPFVAGQDRLDVVQRGSVAHVDEVEMLGRSLERIGHSRLREGAERLRKEHGVPSVALPASKPLDQTLLQLVDAPEVAVAEPRCVEQHVDAARRHEGGRLAHAPGRPLQEAQPDVAIERTGRSPHAVAQPFPGGPVQRHGEPHVGDRFPEQLLQCLEHQQRPAIGGIDAGNLDIHAPSTGAEVRKRAPAARFSASRLHHAFARSGQP